MSSSCQVGISGLLNSTIKNKEWKRYINTIFLFPKYVVLFPYLFWLTHEYHKTNNWNGRRAVRDILGGTSNLKKQILSPLGCSVSFSSIITEAHPALLCNSAQIQRPWLQSPGTKQNVFKRHIEVQWH